MILLRRLITLLAFALAFGLAAPEGSFTPSFDGIQSVEAKSKKRRRRKRRRRRAKRRASKKVTAKKISRWQRKGWSHDKILQKATAANYKVTKRERRRLKKYRVKRSLIKKLANLEAAEATPVRTAAQPNKPINIHETIDPNEIDFDEVPPPDGMPTKYATSQKQEKKRLNTSLRPSAPFKAKASVEETGAPRKRRVVIAAGKE